MNDEQISAHFNADDFEFTTRLITTDPDKSCISALGLRGHWFVGPKHEGDVPTPDAVLTS